ncbi:hypothetical protein ACHQM5_019450 [Ranunculus cassubicifolius]
MESIAINLCSSKLSFPPSSCFKSSSHVHQSRIHLISNTHTFPLHISPQFVSKRDEYICRSSRQAKFCYDKAIPEEIIEKPVAVSERNIGENPRCSSCEARGVVPCATCSSSGLYIDSIMESQGIIVKVRCVDRCSHDL